MADKTYVQVAKNAAFGTTELYADKLVDYASTVKFDVDDIPYGVPVYSRGRYDHTPTGMSGWSGTVSFKVAPPPDIIGVCQYGTGNRIGDFRHIDGAGNFIPASSPFIYQQHPIYAGGMRSVVVDGCDMLEIDTFYIKTATAGPSGSDAAGKPCWWISPAKYEGYRPAAAFKRNGLVKEKLWISKYLGHQETVRSRTCIGSKMGQQPLVNTSRANFITYAGNRNDLAAGVTGFRLFDIWDLSVVRMLLLIFGGGTDTQKIWGDNSTGVVSPTTGATGAAALGLYDLWRCYWYHCDGITTNADFTVQLNNPHNDQKFSTAAKIASSEGWITSFMDENMVIGADQHNTMELFLPILVNSTESAGSFADLYTPPSSEGYLTGRSTGYGSTISQSYWTGYGSSCQYRNWISGTSSTSYWEQYRSASSCPKSTWIAGTASKTYWDQYKTGCPKRTTGGVFECEARGHKPPPYNGNGSVSGCNYMYNTSGQIVHKVCDTGVWGCTGGSVRSKPDGLHGTCPGCGNWVWTTFFGMGASCYMANTCSITYTSGTSGYWKCTYYNTTCKTSSCGAVYSAGSSGWWQCGKSGGGCATSSCTWKYTVDTTVTYTTQCGIFTSGPSAVNTTTAARLSKS